MSFEINPSFSVIPNRSFFKAFPPDAVQSIAFQLWTHLRDTIIGTKPSADTIYFYQKFIETITTTAENIPVQTVIDNVLKQTEQQSISVQQQINNHTRLPHWAIGQTHFYYEGENDDQCIKFSYQNIPNPNFIQSAHWQFIVSFNLQIIAIKSLYDQELIKKYKEIPSRKWNGEYWIFPLEVALIKLKEIPKLFLFSPNQYDVMPYWCEVFDLVDTINKRIDVLTHRLDYREVILHLNNYKLLL